MLRRTYDQLYYVTFYSVHVCSPSCVQMGTYCLDSLEGGGATASMLARCSQVDTVGGHLTTGIQKAKKRYVTAYSHIAWHVR